MPKQTYIAIVERRVDGGWSISFPAFQGTTSAADSIAEILPQARDALETVLDDLRLEHKTPPPSLEEGVGLDYDRARYREPHVLFVDVDTDIMAAKASVTA